MLVSQCRFEAAREPADRELAHAVGVLLLLGMTPLVTWRDVIG